jgi:hypothetical protein
MNKDVLSGIILLAVALVYYWATGIILDSSLADEVGAQGLPRILAFLLAGLAALIIARGLVTARTPQRVAEADPDAEPVAETPRAFGFLALAAGYVMVAPLVGFGPGLALLIAAIAMYEGMRLSWRLALVAACGAFVFWLLFVQILGVEQPRSMFL